jgi:GntR family transcriptional regulator/MocR family aminotransferase
MELVLNLEYGQYAPLFRRLSDALRKAILDGRLPPGTAVPSVRDLASTLGISRATVLRAFADLQAQGYLDSLSGTATYVSRKLPGDLGDVVVPRLPASPAQWRSVDLSSYGHRLIQGQTRQKDLRIQFSKINYGGSPIELTPVAQWKKLLLHYCRLRQIDHAAFSIEPYGYSPLRESLSAYLRRFRAVRCDSDHLCVFANKQLALDAITSLLLDPGDCVAFEEPGFVDARQQIESLGAQIVPVPVDAHGLDVEFLESVPQKIRLVYVTPSHQDPMGAVLPMERRRQLLQWAKRTGAFIIEDDYDSEFRYGGPPLPSLQGMDDDDCVIYMGSLWKMLFQVLRICYVVIPECLKFPLLLAKMQTERHLPVLEQLALTDLMNQGIVEQHIKKTGPTYAARRQALLSVLERRLGERAQILPESGGMHAIVRMQIGLSDATILECAHAAGIQIMSTQPYYFNEPRKGEFMMGFAGIDPSRIERQVKEWCARMRAMDGVR